MEVGSKLGIETGLKKSSKLTDGLSSIQFLSVMNEAIQAQKELVKTQASESLNKTDSNIKQAKPSSSTESEAAFKNESTGNEEVPKASEENLHSEVDSTTKAKEGNLTTVEDSSGKNSKNDITDEKIEGESAKNAMALEMINSQISYKDETKKEDQPITESQLKAAIAASSLNAGTIQLNDPKVKPELGADRKGALVEVTLTASTPIDNEAKGGQVKVKKTNLNILGKALNATEVSTSLTPTKDLPTASAVKPLATLTENTAEKNDLKANELRVLDSKEQPTRIISTQSFLQTKMVAAAFAEKMALGSGDLKASDLTTSTLGSITGGALNINPTQVVTGIQSRVNLGTIDLSKGDFANKIAERIGFAQTSRVTNFVMKIQPEKLGAMEIKLEKHADGIRAVIVASEATIQTLTQQASTIKDNAGLQNLSFQQSSAGQSGNLSQGGQGEAKKDGQSQAERGLSDSSTEQVTEPQNIVSQRSHNGNVSTFA